MECTGKKIQLVVQLKKYNKKYIGNFQVHAFGFTFNRNNYTNIKRIFYFITKSFYLHFFKNRYDVIISPNPLLTGIIAIIVARFTNMKTIIEVNGNFNSAFRFDKLNVSFIYKFKEKIAKKIIPYVLKKADMVKLVYDHQLEPLKLSYKDIKITVFPNFVPISLFLNQKIKDNKYILLLGSPWYLKGVDILIKAFNKISYQFPQYKLKIVGWCPKDREYFETLAKHNPQVELHGPVIYKDVIKLMTECTIYVLASRTDSSPRVLREAMASKKPIIASNVDGVPNIIKDGFNGLLFESENVDDL
ncbi:MAG: glycosyltransferase, partial [Promethearchaeota archaeon]